MPMMRAAQGTRTLALSCLVTGAPVASRPDMAPPTLQLTPIAGRLGDVRVMVTLINERFNQSIVVHPNLYPGPPKHPHVPLSLIVLHLPSRAPITYPGPAPRVGRLTDPSLITLGPKCVYGRAFWLRDVYQVPPGRFRVWAVYDTSRLPTVLAPGRLWRGKVASSEVTIEIRSASPPAAKAGHGSGVRRDVSNGFPRSKPYGA